MLQIMHILGFCVDVSWAACSYFIIDFQPYRVEKSDREEGGGF